MWETNNSQIAEKRELGASQERSGNRIVSSETERWSLLTEKELIRQVFPWVKERRISVSKNTCTCRLKKSMVETEYLVVLENALIWWYFTQSLRWMQALSDIVEHIHVQPAATGLANPCKHMSWECSIAFFKEPSVFWLRRWLEMARIHCNCLQSTQHSTRNQTWRKEATSCLGNFQERRRNKARREERSTPYYSSCRDPRFWSALRRPGDKHTINVEEWNGRGSQWQASKNEWRPLELRAVSARITAIATRMNS